MRRTFVLVAMLFAMLWQSVALARIGSTVNALADTGHAALHWQELDHHHHDDGSYHFDDSKESAQHMVTDHLSASLAVVATPAHRFAVFASTAPGMLRETRAPNPTLDGLLRPPCCRS